MRDDSIIIGINSGVVINVPDIYDLVLSSLVKYVSKFDNYCYRDENMDVIVDLIESYISGARDPIYVKCKKLGVSILVGVYENSGYILESTDKKRIYVRREDLLFSDDYKFLV